MVKRSCLKEALGKSPQGGRTCNLTHGPEPVPLFFVFFFFLSNMDEVTGVLMQGKVSP